MRNIGKLFVTIMMIALMAMVIPYLFTTSENIASDDTGYVTKTVMDMYYADKTIIIITGIHPREPLAINPEIESFKQFALTHRVKMINYNVTVTQDKEDFKKGRYNGEHLVANYVLPDIYKLKADAIIISHSHEPGYGEGFYVATPAMDEASVIMAEKINSSNIDFNYFRTPTNETYKSSSIELVSKPLADSGYPTLVYEIPENITEEESTDRTLDLLNEVNHIINT
ncbi:MAG: hypothetical protein BZ138_02620 [Methanosphaera sp. rholeuAM270]|nr:MAG: hypothetical protein BZ138_02620 [Methanosphaera sp. rholeuAM270]